MIFLLGVVNLASSLTPLPQGISSYEVSAGLRLNPLGEVRRLALGALKEAMAQEVRFAEIEFPPLLGLKNEFADVDNVQILDANRDWTMETCRPLAEEFGGALWVAFPDRKELELARQEWPGGAYSKATLTTIEDTAVALSNSVVQPWGAQFSRFVEARVGSDALGAPADMSRALDPQLMIFCQPGDGGPVEDWINLESCQHEGATMVAVNGAFDKLRGGYYPRLIFPKLGDCIERFITPFEPIFYLKPVSDKGRSGWLFRVFPEPWQVVAQDRDGTSTVVLESDERPTYFQAVDAILKPR